MIIGHQKQWDFLKKSIELGKIPHAFLFWGESQVGKKTVALEFIKLLNCQNPHLNSDRKIISSCQICDNCKHFSKGIHPDLKLIEPQGQQIQISQTRDLKNFLSLKSQLAPYKSVIIDQAHFLNQEAQNSILKALEEPKGKTLLILISEYPERLFPTILSRVQKIQFFPVSRSKIKKYLKFQNLSEQEIEEILRLCWGRPGRAIEFLRDPFKKEFQKKIEKEIPKLIRGDFSFRFRYVKELSQNPQLLKEILEIWLRYFRESLLSQINAQSNQILLARDYSIPKLKKILKTIHTINLLISTTNVNPRLALEILMLEL